MSGYKVIENGRVLTVSDGTMPQYFLVTNEADKPLNPSIGDKVSVTSTGKEYTCFVANVWSLVSSPCYEEYSNHGIVDNLMSSVISGLGSAVTDSTNHKMVLGSGIGVGEASYESKITITPSTTPFEFNVRINSVVGDTKEQYVGLQSASIEAVFKRTNADGWKAYTADSVSIVSTSVTVANGDLLTIKNYGNVILYYVNGILVATHTTVSFGSNTAQFKGYVSSTAGATTAHTLDIDYIGWRIYK